MADVPDGLLERDDVAYQETVENVGWFGAVPDRAVRPDLIRAVLSAG